MIEQIKEMTEIGFSAARIAAKLNLSNEEVRNIIKTNNFKLKKEIFLENKIEHICELYKSGISAKQIGFKYSIDKRRVQKWAKEKGTLRNKNDANRIHHFNQYYFDEIDTPNKAYWLGFFYADAYNSDLNDTFKITLNGKDIGHLNKLATIVNLSLDRVYREINPEGYDVCNIHFYSKHMCEIMTKHGCPRAKSFIIKYPEWLADNLHQHFIRGVFDGDGCLTFRKKQKEWKWSLMSTKEVCEGIHNIVLQKACVNINYFYSSNTNNNTYILITSGNEKIKKVMDWLHSNSTVENRLDRKFEKYQALVLQQNNRAFLKTTSRTEYNISEQDKTNIILELNNGDKTRIISEKYQLHPRTVNKIKSKTIKI